MAMKLEAERERGENTVLLFPQCFFPKVSLEIGEEIAGYFYFRFTRFIRDASLYTYTYIATNNVGL